MFLNYEAVLKREGNRLFTQKEKIYKNIKDSDLKVINKYLYSFELINFGFITYKEDVKLGKVKGSCLAIEKVIKDKDSFLNYINNYGLNANLTNVLDYLIHH